MLPKLARVYPHAVKIPRRLLCGEALRDLSENPSFESLLETTEEIAVFRGDDKWFEPTIPFDEDGKLYLPPNLSTAYVPIISKASQLYTQAHPAVVRLRVAFEDEDGHKQVFYTTGFALSPKILFTDYHCVPPLTSVYAQGAKFPVTFKEVHARWSPLNTRELNYMKESIPLELVSRDNDLENDVPVRDPVSEQFWKRGRGNADLAVLKVPDNHPFSFATYFSPAVLSEKVVGSHVGYIGYPQIIRGNQVDRVMAVIKASGFKFKQFVDILPKEQNMAARLAVETALQECFCDYNVKVVSLGDIKKVGEYALAVTNPSTTGTSGSPYFFLDSPGQIIGNHLGGGLYAPTAPLDHPNYNLVMTNDHPEWVVKYAKYVVPSLPNSIGPAICSYLTKHKGLLQGVMTPTIRALIK
jgi:hypothetical protein